MFSTKTTSGESSSHVPEPRPGIDLYTTEIDACIKNNHPITTERAWYLDWALNKLGVSFSLENKTRVLELLKRGAQPTMNSLQITAKYLMDDIFIELMDHPIFLKTPSGELEFPSKLPPKILLYCFYVDMNSTYDGSDLSKRQLIITESLLSAGINIDAIFENESTVNENALLLAIRRQLDHIVALLLTHSTSDKGGYIRENRADPNIQNGLALRNAMHTLYLSELSNSSSKKDTARKIVNLLLNNGANPNLNMGIALIDALTIGLHKEQDLAAEDNYELAKSLLNGPLPANPSINTGYPLIWACNRYSLTAVQLLLEANANPNIVRKDFTTTPKKQFPLQAVVDDLPNPCYIYDNSSTILGERPLQIFQALLMAGATLETEDHTVLKILMKKSAPEFMDLALAYGAGPFLLDNIEGLKKNYGQFMTHPTIVRLILNQRTLEQKQNTPISEIISLHMFNHYAVISPQKSTASTIELELAAHRMTSSIDSYESLITLLKSELECREFTESEYSKIDNYVKALLDQVLYLEQAQSRLNTRLHETSPVSPIDGLPSCRAILPLLNAHKKCELKERNQSTDEDWVLIGDDKYSRSKRASLS